MKLSQRLLIQVCFLAYLFLLFYLLFFSQYRQSVEGLLTYNLIPFKTIIGYFAHFAGLSITDQFVGNVLAFVPFGFLSPLIVPRLWDFRIIVGSTVLFSFLIEAAQLLFRVGAFDVDDLILNTLGGGIGFFLTKLIK